MSPSVGEAWNNRELGELASLRELVAATPEVTRAQRWAARLVAALFGRWVWVRGVERIATAPVPTVFALNHNNAIETILVAAVLTFLRGRVPGFLVDWMYVQLPVVGWIVRLCEPIPVFSKPAKFRLYERLRLAARRRSPVDGAAAALAAGRDVALFPEGRRNGSAERLEAGRLGIGRLVLETGATVVPIGLRFPAARRSGRVPLIGRLEVEVGEELRFDIERLSLLAESAGPVNVGERRAFAALVVERVMTELSRLSGKCRRRRPGEGHQLRRRNVSGLPASAG